jgi:hypothetical protein
MDLSDRRSNLYVAVRNPQQYSRGGVRFNSRFKADGVLVHNNCILRKVPRNWRIFTTLVTNKGICNFITKAFFLACVCLDIVSLEKALRPEGSDFDSFLHHVQTGPPIL